MNATGYVPKRRGVLDHLQGGRLTLLEYGAYDVIILLADKSSGLWWGSARALAANCGTGDISDRQARHILESLESKGYVKRFPVPRSRRNYPVLVNKFQPTWGAYSGMVLNAAATVDWRNPVFEKCLQHGAQQGAQHGLQHGAERAPLREGEGKRDGDRRRKRSAPAQAPSRDPRHQPFVDFAYKSFEEKRGQPPTWSGKDFKNLGDLLGRAPTATLEELQRRFTAYLDSTDPFIVRNGYGLSVFCMRFDALYDGPILQQGGPNGKPDANDVVRTNLESYPVTGQKHPN